MNTLQTLVLPHLGFTAPEDMYIRAHSDKVSVCLSDNSIIFLGHGRISLDTFFNSVSVGVWKKNCRIDDIGVNLRGSGEFILRFGLHRIGHAHVWLDEQRITLTNEDQCFLLSKWSQIDGGMLYIYLESVFGGVLNGGSWVTSTLPVRNVKLGIVITHYDRKNYVMPAIKRIREQLLDKPDSLNKFELIVVDNSQNITRDEAEGITLIPNKNLGGSGGFTRGLLHLKSDNTFTHCLFMDDDASCEIESIRRTFNLLSYATDDCSAVAGSLLRELEPYRLFEKGALFNGKCIPLKSGMDMRNVNDLLFAELTDRTPDYGGWWFFAFKISGIKEFPFPFFVRGDDSRFSMKNDFKILTMNGVACWGDDFGLKAGVLPTYLDARYHILHAINIRNFDFNDVKDICSHFVMKQLFSYNYSSAKAARMAIQHVMKGPDFFISHMDMSGIRHEISQFASSERACPIDRRLWPIQYGGVHKTRWRNLLRKLSLNGFLLPSFFLRKDVTLFQHKGFMADLNHIFLVNEVLYEYEPTHVGYVARHDKKMFFKELFTYLSVMRQFKKNYDKIKSVWSHGFEKYTSERFWCDVYKD